MTTRIQPDRAALEVAHRRMAFRTPLDKMLQNPAQKAVLESVARKHMSRRQSFDPKKLQANDND